MMSPMKKQDGFTLIEVLVTIGIMGLLSGMIIGYSRNSETQIALNVERDQLIGMVNRARQLALARSDSTICGYRVSFDSASVSIYSVTGSDGACPQVGGTLVQQHALDTRISLTTNSSYVFFTAPYLRVSAGAFPVTVTLSSGSFTPTKLEVTAGGAVQPAQ